jgi:RHS repeat-associated protein
VETEDKETPATDVQYQYVWDIRYVDSPILRDENKDMGTDNICTEPANGPQGSNTGDEHLYYCNDANYNVTALVDVYDGAVVERYVYDPYGKTTILDGVRDRNGESTTEWEERQGGADFGNDILYCGYRYDAESGLFHVRNRYHDPSLGRFVSRDPTGYIDGMSLYEYVRSNPASATDAMGLDVDSDYAKCRQTVEDAYGNCLIRGAIVCIIFGDKKGSPLGAACYGAYAAACQGGRDCWRNYCDDRRDFEKGKICEKPSHWRCGFGDPWP